MTQGQHPYGYQAFREAEERGVSEAHNERYRAATRSQRQKEEELARDALRRREFDRQGGEKEGFRGEGSWGEGLAGEGEGRKFEGRVVSPPLSVKRHDGVEVEEQQVGKGAFMFTPLRPSPQGTSWTERFKEGMQRAQESLFGMESSRPLGRSAMEDTENPMRVSLRGYRQEDPTERNPV